MKNICFEKRFLSDLKSLSTLVAASSHLFVNVGGGPLCLLVDLHLEHLVLHRKFGPQRNIVVVCVIDHLGSFGLHHYFELHSIFFFPFQPIDVSDISPCAIANKKPTFFRPKWFHGINWNRVRQYGLYVPLALYKQALKLVQVDALEILCNTL